MYKIAVRVTIDRKNAVCLSNRILFLCKVATPTSMKEGCYNKIRWVGDDCNYSSN